MLLDLVIVMKSKNGVFRYAKYKANNSADSLMSKITSIFTDIIGSATIKIKLHNKEYVDMIINTFKTTNLEYNIYKWILILSKMFII